MKNLRLLIGAVVLTCGVGLVTPVWPQSGCEPGQMSTPPCGFTQLTTDDPTVPEELETLTPSNIFEIASTVEEALVAFLLF
jgi:hypothetical protein